MAWREKNIHCVKNFGQDLATAEAWGKCWKKWRMLQDVATLEGFGAQRSSGVPLLILFFHLKNRVSGYDIKLHDFLHTHVDEAIPIKFSGMLPPLPG